MAEHPAASGTSEVSAVPVATTPLQTQVRNFTFGELREFCTWQNVLSCAFALCAGALAHNPGRVWRWIENKRVEIETLGAAWEITGVLVVVVLAANALRVYTAMARRRLSAKAPADGGSEDLAAGVGRKSVTKKSKKTTKRPKLSIEFIRK